MVGEMLPDVEDTNSDGEAVKLSEIHAQGPADIVFFRGSWCPYCIRHFGDLIKIHPDVAKLGAQMVAISPDTVKNTKGNEARLSAPFPLLSDSDMSATKKIGLAFTVDDATLTKYKGFGIDLEQASGHKHHTLPVPAVFIVDKSGKIVYAHSNPDYAKRLDADTIVAELKKRQ